MSTVVFSAAGERRIPALRLLFARFPVEEHETRLRDAIASSERGTLHLDHLLLAESDGLPVGSALVMLQSDGIALVWPPVVSCGAADPTEVEDLLMREVCQRADAASAKLGQCLLSPGDEAEAAILSRHGFECATDMFFLARAITDADRSPAPAQNGQHVQAGAGGDGITIETYCAENADRFSQVVEATYRGSLDCPYLNGLRTGVEAIASHKLSGQFDPARWALYAVDGRDAGVILLNDHPDQDAIELVYLGVAPEARGQGLGRRMLRDGLRESAQRGRAVMFLAVDCENHFANSLYGEFDFAELARRRVMLRRQAGLSTAFAQ